MAINRRVSTAADYMIDEDDERPTKAVYDEDEDEDDEPVRPAKKRRVVEDDEDEPRPAKKRRAPVDEDDDDEDDEDDEPVRPAKRKPAPVDEDDDEEEDPDEIPARSSIVQSGWAAAKKRMKESSTFVDEFKFEEDPKVVKFLSNEPLAYLQHWLKARAVGKKSFVCLGDDCPLCEKLGDRPTGKYAFSVVSLSDPGMPTQLLIAGTKLATLLDKYNTSAKTGPLDKGFWALSKSGTGTATTYAAQHVKERDLEDDWEVEVDAMEIALAKAKPLGGDAVHITPKSELLAVARELLR